ncbi:MAG: hypothetical protein ACRDH8_12730 [Actinomycetota bacterium]
MADPVTSFGDDISTPLRQLVQRLQTLESRMAAQEVQQDQLWSPEQLSPVRSGVGDAGPLQEPSQSVTILREQAAAHSEQLATLTEQVTSLEEMVARTSPTADLSADVAPLRDRLASLTEQVTSLEGMVAQASSTPGLSEDVGPLREHLASQEETLANQSAQLATLVEQLGSLERRIAEGTPTPALSEDLAPLRDHLASQAQHFASQSEQLETVGQQLGSLSQGLGSLAEQLASQQGRVDEENATLAALLADLSSLADRIGAFERAFSAAASSGATGEQVDRLGTALSSVLENVAGLERRITEGTSPLEAMTEALSSLGERIRSLEESAAESGLVERLDLLHGSVASVAEQISAENPTDALLLQRVDEGLASIERRLGSLEHRVEGSTLEPEQLGRLAGRLAEVEKVAQEGPIAPALDLIDKALAEKFKTITRMLESRMRWMEEHLSQEIRSRRLFRRSSS